MTMFFGQYLLEQRAITREALLEALDRQRRSNWSVLDLAVRHGALTPGQRDLILVRFRTSDRALERICVEEGHLDRATLEELVAEQGRGWLRIGDALVEGGHLTRDQVTAHLEAYRARQAEVERQVEHSFEEFSEPATVRTFFSLATFYFGRLLERTVKLESVGQVGGGGDPRHRRYAQRFVGDRSLAFAVDLEEGLAGELAGALLGTLRELPSETVHDAVCELVNVVGGNACTRMEVMGWRVRPEPASVSGPRPPLDPDGPAVRGIAVCEEDRFELRLYGAGGVG